MKDLWVEKYRPNSIDTYVFRDDNQHRQVAGWLEDGALPHLMRIFSASEQAVKFEAKTPRGVEQAAQATDYCNWVF